MDRASTSGEIQFFAARGVLADDEAIACPVLTADFGTSETRLQKNVRLANPARVAHPRSSPGSREFITSAAGKPAWVI